VHSYVYCFPGFMGCTSSGSANSSFGNFAADVSVAYNMPFLETTVAPVPEPRTMFLVGLALVAVAFMGERRRRE